MAIEILDKGACKAAGTLSTAALPAGVLTQGIRRVIATGVNGRAQLELEDAIAAEEFLPLATCFGPLALTDGFIPVVTWLTPTLVEIATYNGANPQALALGQVYFIFFRIVGGLPEIVPLPPIPT
jgi:hypothetical protein